MHSKISRVLDSKRGSSKSKIEVPIEADNEIVGWKTIRDADTMHDTNIERNIYHLEQARPTPLQRDSIIFVIVSLSFEKRYSHPHRPKQ